MDVEYIATMLMAMMEENGLPIDSKPRMRQFIYHAFNDDRIKFIQENEKVVGFMMWEVHEVEGKKHVYVSHLVIIHRVKGYNLKILTTFLKNKYQIGNSEIHWHSHRRNKQVDFNKKELTHV